MSPEIAAQVSKVKTAYFTGGVSDPVYEQEFVILSTMRAAAQAERFRKERGLPPAAKTPYDARAKA